jgi:uncharacterized protein with FMN-binding domain
VRRAALALIGATAGTTLVIIAKLGPEPTAAQSVPLAGATPSPTTLPSSASPTPTATHSSRATHTTSSRATHATSSRATHTATPSPSHSTTRAASKTVAGPAVTEKYGTIQVTITIVGSKMTDLKASYPTGGRTGDINAAAIPKLRQEALTAQSANIATVSGATYTSGAYKQSLQGALDKSKA